MSKTTKTIIGIIVVVIIIVGIWYGVSRKPREEVIKIGVILPLTGSAAQYGQWAKNGLELAVEEINNQGGIEGKNIIILFEDSKSDVKEGISAFNNLIVVHNIQAVITEFSGFVLSAAPIAEEKKVVLLNVGALNPQIRKAGDYVFSNINDANIEAYKLAEFAFDQLKIKKLALLSATASYGKGNRDAIKEQFIALGGQIVADESFEENVKDVRTQLWKLKNSQPGAVFISAVTRDAALVLNQAKELGFKTQWLSTAFFEGEDLIKIAGDAAEGAIYTTTILDTRRPEVNVFIAKYKEKYRVDPELYSATAYDGFKILAMAIQKVGNNGLKIKEFLYTVKDYPGISGITTFDSDGAVEKPVLFKTVKNGQFLLLE